MRYSTAIMAAFTAVVAISLLAEAACALPTFSGTQTAAGAGSVIMAAGTEASVPVIQVNKKGGGGHHRGGFRGWGFYGGWPGGYGGYYSPYGYQGGSYLDTPTRTCVWNGYEYRCYEFQDEVY